MGYTDVAALSGDSQFISRVAACYALETVSAPQLDPYTWASNHAWQLAAQPGFGDSYTYARETGVEDPGKNPAVITDNQILAAVQSLLIGG
jgi:hypothetical protein